MDPSAGEGRRDVPRPASVTETGVVSPFSQRDERHIWTLAPAGGLARQPVAHLSLAATIGSSASKNWRSEAPVRTDANTNSRTGETCEIGASELRLRSRI